MRAGRTPRARPHCASWLIVYATRAQLSRGFYRRPAQSRSHLTARTVGDPIPVTERRRSLWVLAIAVPLIGGFASRPALTTDAAKDPRRALHGPAHSPLRAESRRPAGQLWLPRARGLAGRDRGRCRGRGDDRAAQGRLCIPPAPPRSALGRRRTGATCFLDAALEFQPGRAPRPRRSPSAPV